MKRLWIGVVLMTTLLVGGIWLSLALSGAHEDLSRQLSAASDAALGQNWEKADAHMSLAEADWQRYRAFTAAFTDHEPLEEIDRLFAQVEICRSLSLEVDYSYVCSSLSQICSAIAESMKLPWWNLL